MCGGDKDRATRVSSLTNEEPLVVVKACVDIVWEVIRENGSNSRNGVIGERETPLRCGGCRSVRERAFSTEDGYISRGWGSRGYRGSEVFTSRGSNKDIVRVNGDIFVERSEEEGVEDFLSDLGGSGRHCRWRKAVDAVLSYNVLRPGFLRGMFGWFS